MHYEIVIWDLFRRGIVNFTIHGDLSKPAPAKHEERPKQSGTWFHRATPAHKNRGRGGKIVSLER